MFLFLYYRGLLFVGGGLHLLSNEFIENRFQQLRLLSFDSNKDVLFWVEQAGASAESRYPPLFGILIFLVIFLPMFQGAISALRVLNIFSKCINSPGQKSCP